MERTVYYIFRKSKTFSIERVFRSIVDEVHNFGIIPKQVVLPSMRDSGLGLMRNIVFVLRIRFLNRKVLFHITGDNHYIALFLNPMRTILTIHDNIKVHLYKGIKRKIAMFFWLELPIKRSIYLTSISEKTKDEIIELTNCNSSKIEVIYNPIDKRYKFIPKIFNKAKPRILHIGTRPNKNLINLIGGLCGINCFLIIIGQVSKDLIILLHKNKIDFASYNNLSDSAILEMYQSCDIVSFITYYEGFGMPIIEGQSIGRVVICSATQPHMEIAGNGAIFVDPEEIEEINKAFIKIIENDKLRNSIIDEGCKNVARFTVSSIAKSYSTLYYKVWSDRDMN